MLLVAFIVILLIIKFLIIIWTYRKVSSGMCKFSGHLVGKVVIVTGANSGIGFETAKDLAQRGARVILACRSLERGACAKQKIIASSGNKDVRILQLDLESFTSIRKFVDSIYETEKRLDVLINNAGMYVTDNKMTDDGVLRGMQINYFGPFLLTSLLLPLLEKSAPSRIVNVSSFLYALGRIDFDKLNVESCKHKVYRNAKLCTMLITTELERRLKGTGVTANCLHPGVVSTNMISNLNNIVILTVLKLLQSFFKNSWEGAQTSIYLAVSPEVEKVSGKYFKDCQLAELTPKAQNIDVAHKLWDVSEKIVKLK
ncbi:retinol dehydrogenase 14-like [Maniola hyperantus]|uniref:retinol dehydrogenase 14-like n=1 Tax=Aphantopus hyperantus TaxID=2795564 RepID=UPI0015680117|nr:retinol dehydrogenase 14-like [Maniola hyperantus]